MALKYKAKNNMYVLESKRQKLGFGTYTNTRESWPSKLRWLCTLYLGLCPIFYSYILFGFVLLNLTHHTYTFFDISPFFSSPPYFFTLVAMGRDFNSYSNISTNKSIPSPTTNKKKKVLIVLVMECCCLLIFSYIN